MIDAIYAVYGVSGYGREVMPLARDMVQRLGVDAGQLVFVDDYAEQRPVNGHRVLRYAEFLALESREKRIALAIANSAIREKLDRQCQADGVLPWTIQAANLVSMDDVVLGDGAILSPFVTLTSNIRIGRQFHANIYSFVAHDCVIGDYVTFAPGVNCLGNVVVEDHAYIGTGAILRQGKPGVPLVIGRGAVVGMGAVVTRSVEAGTTVIGNPARMMVKS